MTSREIDGLVAKHIMNTEYSFLITVDSTQPPNTFTFGEAQRRPLLPHYSTDIKAAWEVVDWLETNVPEQPNNYYGPYFFVLEKSYDIWSAGYMFDVPYDGWCEHPTIYATHESAPMAICLAALKIKGIEVEPNP